MATTTTMVVIRLIQFLLLEPILSNAIECNVGWGALRKLQMVPEAWMNDGFCDCPIDGVDEPNTEACSGSGMGGWAGVPLQLQDESTLPHYACPEQPNLVIPLSRIHDTICDCCDGSDEDDCPDTCEVVLAEQRREEDRLRLDFIHGFKTLGQKMNEFKSYKIETEVKMVQLTDVISEKEDKIATLKFYEENATNHWIKNRRQLLSGPGNLDFLSVMNEEEIKLLIVAICRMVGEGVHEGSEKNYDDKGACFPMKLAAADLGWSWHSEFAPAEARSTEEISNSQLLKEIFIVSKISKDNYSEKNNENTDEDYYYHNALHDISDSNDDPFDHDSHNEKPEVKDLERRKMDTERFRKKREREALERNQENNEHSPEGNNEHSSEGNNELSSEENTEDEPAHVAREALRKKLKAMLVKIDSILESQDGDEFEDEGEDDYADEDIGDNMDELDDRIIPDNDNFKEEVNPHGEEIMPGDNLMNVDPISIQKVKADLQTLLDQIVNGESYAQSADGVMNAVLSSKMTHEDLIRFAVVTIFHSQISSPDLAQIILSILPGDHNINAAMQNACNTVSSDPCQAHTITRQGIVIPPEYILKPYTEQCKMRSSIITCQSVDTIPDAIPDGFMGYFRPLFSHNDTLHIDLYHSLEKMTDQFEFQETKNQIDVLTGEVNNYQNDYTNFEDSIDDQKFGPSGLLYALKDTCETFDTTQYQYEICFFGKAFQRDSGQTTGGTDLGKWQGLHITDGMLSFSFENGAKCWNGPARSAHIKVTCGQETKLTAVDEPEICTYHFEMESYIMCDSLFAARHGIQLPVEVEVD